jgi:hypothetical protein
MQLIQDKGHLIKQCNELVEAVKEQERELSTEVRTVYKDAEGSIESEKKAFRAGYEDRLHKVGMSVNQPLMVIRKCYGTDNVQRSHALRLTHITLL